MTPLPADLFATTPKTDPQSFYDRESEMEQLRRAVEEGRRLVLVKGIRRIGKTSLLKVVLGQLGTPFIYIDLRALESYEFKSLYGLFSEELTKFLPLRQKLVMALKQVRGVSVGDASVSFDLGERRPSFLKIFAALDRWAADEGFSLPVVFDEAQELRFFRGGRRGIDFRKVLAYCYDNFEKTSFILSGSEVGLLHNFLGVDDRNSPLYGRYVVEVSLDRLEKNKSLDFLRKGFAFHGLSLPEEVLEEVVAEFDGVVGWLTFFGAETVRLTKLGKTPNYSDLIKEISEKAVELAAAELEKLAFRSPLYVAILAAIGREGASWSTIKLKTEKLLSRTVSKPQLYTALRTLADLNYLTKQGDVYKALDPLTVRAAEKLVTKYLRKKPRV